MKHISCEHCDNNRVPINETVKVDGSIFCKSCFESTFTEKEQLKGKKIEKELDSTICSSCGKDNGSLELNKISKYPICEECDKKIRNKTFPKWVKAFLVFILAIVVFGFYWNWRYYQAYSLLKQSGVASSKGDFNLAYNNVNKASQKVPEVQDLRILTSYYRGINLLSEDKSTEALEEFNKCIGHMPEDFKLDVLLIEARIGSSFEKKDYSGFLEATKEYLAIDTTIADSWAAVASAYAAVYASSGADSAKRRSYEYIEKAKSIDSTSKDLKEYFNMIEYRIYSRQILKREDFTKLYPNGWTKP